MSSPFAIFRDDGEGILEQGKVAVLRGPTGGAKTRLAVRMLVRFASGMPWLDGVTGRFDGGIAFVSLKNSDDETKRMIFEECAWSDVTPSSLRSRLRLFTTLDWRSQIAASGETYGLIIIDDATNDGHCGSSLDYARRYMLGLERLTMELPGNPAIVVVQSIVNGTSSLFDFARRRFRIYTPTCEYGCAQQTVRTKRGEVFKPWMIYADSNNDHGAPWKAAFQMTSNGIEET